MNYFTIPGLKDRPKLPTRTPEQILAKVSEMTRIPVARIIGPRRFRELADARFCAIYLIKKYCKNMSLKSIGQIFGDRDHTTVIAAINQAECLIKTDHLFKQWVQNIESNL